MYELDVSVRTFVLISTSPACQTLERQRLRAGKANMVLVLQFLDFFLERSCFARGPKAASRFCARDDDSFRLSFLGACLNRISRFALMFLCESLTFYA